MGLRHFLFTIPLNSLVLTVLFMYAFPYFGVALEYYQMFTLLVAINAVVTVIAVLIIRDGPKKRGPAR